MEFTNVKTRSILFVAMATLVVPTHRVQSQAAAADTTRPKPLGAVVISATRTEQTIRSVPLHVVVIEPKVIETSAAQTVPDLLRMVPGFNTRDVQSHMVTGPGASMVSFRGLGGSSAGRALVLLDGVPAGDPFSGWLDWSRIPLPLLESAEVVRGGGSMVWGSRSLGGVVNLRTIAPQRNELRLMMESGSLGTNRAAGSGTIRGGSLTATLGGDVWKTDGFFVLPPEQRGPADTKEENENRAFSGKVSWDASQSLRLWLAGGTFDGGQPPIGSEDRVNFDEGRGGARWLTSKGVATMSTFTNNRTNYGYNWGYNSGRTTRTLSRSSVSPARSSGVSLQWTQMAFERHELTVGADASTARGSLREKYSYSGEVAAREREGRGEQSLAGLFLQDVADLGHGVRLLASIRTDRIENSDGRRLVRDLSQGTIISDSLITATTKNSTTWSLGLRWQQSSWLAWRGNVYEAFRAPSMYEMYHPRFSSRGTVTEANAGLDPERLKGGEVGVDITLGSSLVTRVTAFTNRVSDPIMDVTIATAGSQPQNIPPCGVMPANQTCGQRQNVPELRTHGIESELEWRPSAPWRLTAGYSFSPTEVRAPGKPIDGMTAIRSPRHSVLGGVSFDSPRIATIGIDARYVGSRFDDDLNEIELDGFYLLGLRINRSLGQGVTAYLKLENALDEEFEITRTRAGVADMGAPRWLIAGLRLTR
jgi:outer membrane cobalamin receptor